MRTAALLGIGQVSAAGAGIEALRRALAGSPPSPAWVGRKGRPDLETVPVLVARPDIGDLVPSRALRRLDAFSQRFLLAALLAKQDAGAEYGDPERIGVVIATAYGPIVTSFAFLDGAIDEGETLGSPTLFSSSVHNAAASTIGSVLGVRGPSLTIAGFSHAFAGAIEIALDWLESGEVDQVLLGAGDEYHAIVGYGLERLGAWPPDGRARPLDLGRWSYVPGETFAVMLLGRGGGAPTAWGTIEEPRRFRDALPEASTAPGEPLFLSATGDLTEARAYREIAGRAGRVAAYTSLWGANPSCDAMTAVAAAVSLRDRTFYEVPYRDSADPSFDLLVPGDTGSCRAIRCCALDRWGGGSLVRVVGGSGGIGA